MIFTGAQVHEHSMTWFARGCQRLITMNRSSCCLSCPVAPSPAFAQPPGDEGCSNLRARRAFQPGPRRPMGCLITTSPEGRRNRHRLRSIASRALLQGAPEVLYLTARQRKCRSSAAINPFRHRPALFSSWMAYYKLGTGRACRP